MATERDSAAGDGAAGGTARDSAVGESSATAARDAERERLFLELRETGSQDVRNRLVESYAPLVVYFAKRYSNRGVPDEDLRQTAQLACVKAVDRFDPTLGIKFSTFAGRTIEGELKRYFRDKTWAVRVPRSLQERSAEVRKTIDAMSADLGRPPSVQELAERTGYSDDEIIEALDVQTAYRASSIDLPAGTKDDGPGHALAARLGETDGGFHQAEVSMAVQSLIEKLPDREREIIELRFFGGLKQQEIADRMGISQMHVSRLLRRALDQMRVYLPAGD
ncbi:MAG: SigB/SigF/SigG family RNA polymerase sigma factor [Acidimicrobiales bacterium]